MTAATITRPTLREIILDALEDAFWARRAGTEECRACSRQPAGICGDHEADNDLASLYEEARKQIQNTPGDGEVLAVTGGTGEGQS